MCKYWVSVANRSDRDIRAKRGSRNDPLLAAALLALNNQRKQGGGPSNLVTCQAFAWKIANPFDGLTWMDCSALTMLISPRFNGSSYSESLLCIMERLVARKRAWRGAHAVGQTALGRVLYFVQSCRASDTAPHARRLHFHREMGNTSCELTL